MVLQITQYILFIIQAVLLIFVGYLDLLMVAAWGAKQNAPDRTGKLKTFAILIPAHNEEVLLPELLESIKRLDYPGDHYHVHVIADNCTDRTAAIASSYNAQVHIRHNTTLIGKGYALEWGLNEIRAAGQKYDAFIIIDADSTVSTNFLQVMNREANAGAKVVQAYYAVKDPGLSWNISLRFAALAVLHYLRPSGRMVLGGSAGLKGNGMLFTEDILARHPWPASVTEDIEYHTTLLLDGYAVKFAPDATVWGEMPIRFEQSQTQLDRWEHGRLEMARKYVPPLLNAGWRSFRQKDFRQAYCYLDATIEHFIPPFAILFSSALLLFMLDAALLLVTRQPFAATMRAPLTTWDAVLGFLLVAGQIIYLMAGLRMVKAPPVIYRQLVFAPLYILLKIAQYVRILSGSKPQKWVKTARNQD